MVPHKKSSMRSKAYSETNRKMGVLLFSGDQCFIINAQAQQVVTNIIDRQKIILNCLGKTYWEFYS